MKNTFRPFPNASLGFCLSCSMASFCLVLSIFPALFLVGSIDIPLANAQERSGATVPGIPIYPVWKLLTHEQRAQYLAGYVQGWRDASKVTDIAIEFVKANPDEAVRGLESLRTLYDLSDVSPSLLVRQIDNFFSKVENRDASLSFAISAARTGAH